MPLELSMDIDTFLIRVFGEWTVSLLDVEETKQRKSVNLDLWSTQGGQCSRAQLAHSIRRDVYSYNDNFCVDEPEDNGAH